MDGLNASQHLQRGSQLENSTCIQGEHEQHRGENILVRPLPLMSKGESVLVFLLPSSPKGEIVGIMIQVLSLMETHSESALVQDCKHIFFLLREERDDNNMWFLPTLGFHLKSWCSCVLLLCDALF